MNRKTMSVAIALTLALTTSGSVLASPSASSLNDIKQQKQDLQVKVEKLDTQISKVMSEVSKNQKDIKTVSSNVDNNKKKLKESEGNIQQQQQLFNKRAKAMYINGMDSYVGVILNSNSITDLVSRIDTVKRVMGSDQEVINDLKDKQQQLALQKQKLDSENNKLQSLKSDNESKLAKLNSDKSSEKGLISDLDKKEQALASTSAGSDSSKAIAAASDDVQKIRSEAPSISRGGSASSASSSSIVAYASNFLGVPYVWGGTSPSGFDCSGFVQYVYAHFGISIPRTSQEQQGVGTSVSRGNLQPGDLVFFGSPAYHVGIYVGNGSYINAPKTGDVVKIASVDRSDFSGGRRVK